MSEPSDSARERAFEALHESEEDDRRVYAGLVGAFGRGSAGASRTTSRPG